jgi:GTPase SAR1 family protein
LNGRIEKNRKQPGIKIIDVSGERKFRQKSWSQYYDQIHGLIFVIDASEKKRLSENQEILEDLLQHEKLKNKPVLM